MEALCPAQLGDVEWTSTGIIVLVFDPLKWYARVPAEQEFTSTFSTGAASRSTAMIRGQYAVQSRLHETLFGGTQLYQDLSDDNGLVAVKQIHIDFAKHALERNLQPRAARERAPDPPTLPASTYIVMEYCEGGDLWQMPELQALPLFAQIKEFVAPKKFGDGQIIDCGSSGVARDAAEDRPTARITVEDVTAHRAATVGESLKPSSTINMLVATGKSTGKRMGLQAALSVRRPWAYRWVPDSAACPAARPWPATRWTPVPTSR
ncbi:hypothetical protein ON010_g17841 [Phytophthora cinnamomi]|nr:hypothetical protein ON010_g17841 [Phytophthora cinnamomi]